MFKIIPTESGVLAFKGNFNAGKLDIATEVLDALNENTTLDFTELRYVSSVGLGLLLNTHKRLEETGAGLRIINASDHIRELFRITRFDNIIDIE